MDKKHVLIIGPWIGEFGWELFKWQGHMRGHVLEKESYDHVIAISRKGNQILYEDFCDEFIQIDVPINNCCGPTNKDVHFYSFKRDLKDVAKQSKYNLNELINSNVTQIFPNINGEINQNNPKYIKYGNKTKEYEFDVVIHARHFKNYKSEKDWGIKKWDELIEWLLDNGLKVASIGYEEASYCHEGTLNLQEISLRELSNVLASSKMLIGNSSGPIHFGSLCGCKHITWGDFDSVFERYEKAWNPLDTPCQVIGKTWEPNLKDIKNAVEKWI